MTEKEKKGLYIEEEEDMDETIEATGNSGSGEPEAKRYLAYLKPELYEPLGSLRAFRQMKLKDKKYSFNSVIVEALTDYLKKKGVKEELAKYALLKDVMED